MKKLLVFLALLSFATPLWAQNRQTPQRVAVQQEFRVPIRTDCLTLTRQRIGDLCFDSDFDIDGDGDGDGILRIVDSVTNGVETWKDVSRINSSNTLPSTCVNGELFIDNDATTGQRMYACESGVFVQQAGAASETNDLEADDPPNVLDDEVYIGSTTAGQGTWIALPNCTDDTLEGIGYNAATNAFECHTITGTGHVDGANCADGEIPLGVDAAGATQGCYEPTEADISGLSHLATSITDGLIIEADLNEDSGSPTDEDVLTFDNAGGNFNWIAQSALVAGTATALASNPTDCAADTFATTIAASGNLTCEAVDGGTGGEITDNSITADDIATDGVGVAEFDDDGNTPTAGDVVIVEAGAASFDYITQNAGTDITADLEEEGQINATVVTGNIVADQVLTGSGANAAVWLDLPNCVGNNMLTFTQGTPGSFGCDADDGAGGGAPIGVQYITNENDATLSNEKILTDGTGIDVVIAGGDGGSATLNLDYTAAIGSDPTLNVDECVFTTDGTGGGIICEGSVTGGEALIEGLLQWAPTTSDRTLTLPDATDTLVGRATTDTLTNKTIDATNTVTINAADITDQNAGTNIANDLEEESHATEHKHGNPDEIATATPGADEIVKAEGDGDINAGWISQDSAYTWLASHDFGGGLLEIPNQVGACVVTDCDNDTEKGRVCVNTAATSGRQFFVCEGLTNGWVEHDGAGGGGSGAFLDTSDPVVLNTPAKDVVIGPTALNTSKLTIDGDADQVQLTLQGFSTQTDSVVIVETSAAVEVFNIEASGDIRAQSIQDIDGPGTDWSVSSAGAAVFDSVSTSASGSPSIIFDDNDFADGTDDGGFDFNCPTANNCNLDIMLDNDGTDTELSVLSFATSGNVTTTTFQNIGSLTVSTGSTGDGEVVLPDQSISSTEIKNNTIIATDLNPIISFSDGDLLDFGTFISSTTEGILLPAHATTCASATAEGQVCWEEDANNLWVGDGAAAVQMNAAGANSFGIITDGSTPAGSDSAGDTLTVTDSSTINFVTSDAPEDLTASVVLNSIDEATLAATITFADGDFIDFNTIDIGGATEGILLPGADSCASSTGEGQICWDQNDDSVNALWIGDGTTVRNIGAAGGFTSWLLTGDDGAPAVTITDSNTLAVTGGTGITTEDGDAGADTLSITCDQASTTVFGCVSELATDGETNTGTDTARVMTPSNLEAWTGGASGTITTLGTITTGVWQGTSIADAAVNNDLTIDLATTATTANNLAADGLNLMTEIATIIKRPGDDTDSHLLTTSAAIPAGNKCLEMDTAGSIVLGADTCALLGPGGTTTIDALADAVGAGAVTVGSNAEYGQVWTWNTPATTVGQLDGLTLAMELDATTDGQVQNILVVERSDGAGTTAMDALLELNNNEATAVVDAAITIASAAGGITTAIEMNDAQITNAFITPNATLTLAELELLDGGARTDEALCTYETIGNSLECDVNSEGPLETALGNVDVVTITTDDITSADLIIAVSNETGSGLLVFGTNATLINPALGTPSGIVLTNGTLLPSSAILNERRSMYWGAGAISTDATDCSAPAEATINSGPKLFTITCPMASSETNGILYGSTVMPDGYDGGTVTLELDTYMVTDAGSGTMHTEAFIMCRTDDTTIDSTWGTSIDIDLVTAAGDAVNEILTATSAAIIGNSCAAGEMLFWKIEVCDTDATPDGNCTSSAGLENDLTVLGVKMEYFSNVGDN